jgi:hypothetical protein
VIQKKKKNFKKKIGLKMLKMEMNKKRMKNIFLKELIKLKLITNIGGI